MQLNTTDVLVVGFHAGGDYSQGTVFALQSGQIGADIEKGSFTVSGETVTAIPTSASCPTRPHTATVARFSISNDNLTLTDETGALVFEKAPTDMTAGAAVVFGCSEGTNFTPHAIVPL